MGLLKNKKPIAVVFSDIHFNKWKQYNENNIRTKQQLDIWKEIEALCLKLDVPALFAGDLIDNESYITNQLFHDIMPTLVNSKHTIIGIDGNHDQDTLSAFDTKPHSYFKTLSLIKPNFQCVNFGRVSYEIGDKKIYVHGVPYINYNIGLFDYLENNIKPVSDGINILLLHSDMPNAKDTDGRELNSSQLKKSIYKTLSKFDRVFCGHIHRYQELSDNTIMVGATQQQRKSDSGCDMGYLILFDDMSVERVLTKASKFLPLEEGKEKPDDFNFYFTVKREKKSKDSPKEINTDSIIVDKELIKTYAKNKGISKVKTKKLLKLLK